MADADMSENQQFDWAVREAYRLNGPARIIGTFTPSEGDIGRDLDNPNSVMRVWHNGCWHPQFEVIHYPSLAKCPVYPQTEQKGT